MQNTWSISCTGAPPIPSFLCHSHRRRHMGRFSLGALAACALAFGARANNNDTAAQKADPAQAKLVHDLHDANLHEIKMGGLALENGGNDVRAFGKMLVDDHTKADVALL